MPAAPASCGRSPARRSARSSAPTACDVCDGDGRSPRTRATCAAAAGARSSAAKVAVDVPAGIADGQRIRVTGRGHAGERGGPAGDLYVLVRVREDPRFVRDGDDLVTAVDVAAPLAALGTTVEVPTVDGTGRARDPGRHPAARDADHPRRRACRRCAAGRRGDLRVVVNVVIPRHLKREQRELLEQLADSLTDENLRTDEGVFGKLSRAFGG